MPNKVARRAVRRARQRGATPRELKALVAAGLVESNMQHLRGGDRDSTGFLQQRPSQGWGPVGESVERDTDQFLEQAMRINRSGFSGSAGQLAQAVQRSAFPERYDQRGAEAERLIRDLLGRRAAGGGTAPQAPRFDTETVPGVDRSRDRRMLLAQYLLGGTPGGLVGLKAGLEGAADTPARTVRARIPPEAQPPGRRMPTRGEGDLLAPVKTMERWAKRLGVPVTAGQEPGHAAGGDHDPAVPGATARDFGGPEERRRALFEQITRALGVPNAEYKGADINLVRNGVRYQIISRDHGTGPHLHVGMRRVA